MTRLKTKLLLSVFVIAIILLSLESVISQRNLPPGWEETCKVFETEQEFSEFVGDTCLMFDSADLNTEREYFLLEAEENGLDDPDKWIELYLHYRFDDQSEVTVQAYFDELEKTPSFPLHGVEMQSFDIEGVLVKCQEYKRNSNASVVLFTYGGNTYEVTIRTTGSSPDVESYLRRIIPSEEKNIGPTDFGDAVIGSGKTATEIITTEQK